MWFKTMLGLLLARALPKAEMANPRAFEIFEDVGYHVTPTHFYSPIPTTKDLTERAWRAYDFAFDEKTMLATCERFIRHDVAGLEGQYGYTFDNGYFGALDAAAYYGLIRESRPSKIIEIGAGWSSRIALTALEDNGAGTLVTVEPYDMSRLPIEPTYRVPVEQLPVETFDDLGAGDMLFVDSSHVARIGGDVTFLILRVLPRLQRGVLVHFHDIFLPDEYPPDWVLGLRRFWSEQYLLHAYLLENTAVEVVWASHYLATRHAELVGRLTRPRQPTLPSSFWMRRVTGSGHRQTTTSRGVASHSRS
jgi:hypothetical protein